MRRHNPQWLRFACVLLALWTALTPLAASGKGSQKTVHVKEYKRKDGTTVKAHDRSAPDSKGASTTNDTKQGRASSSATSARDDARQIKRSAAAKDEFMRQTGYSHGRPGYVVDHIVPLACGGADAPSNMQWQTVEAAKAKDKVERIGCGSFSRAPAVSQPWSTSSSTATAPSITTIAPSSTTYPAAVAVAPAIGSTSMLNGKSESQVQERLGPPSLANGGVWYYDTAKGTLKVYFTGGAVSSVSPSDFNVGEVNQTRAAAADEKQKQAEVPPSPPPGAIARCGDGSYVLAAHQRGVCYGHGGVAEQLQK